MKMKGLLLAACGAIAWLTGGCGAEQPEVVTPIAGPALHDLMQREDIFLVDVHIPEQRHIRGTDLFVPYNEIQKQRERFPQDKSTSIYLYCRSGRMAMSAAQALQALGYRKVFNLEGGTEAWRAAGFEFD